MIIKSHALLAILYSNLLKIPIYVNLVIYSKAIISKTTTGVLNVIKHVKPVKALYSANALNAMPDYISIRISVSLVMFLKETILMQITIAKLATLPVGRVLVLWTPNVLSVMRISIIMQ